MTKRYPLNHSLLWVFGLLLLLNSSRILAQQSPNTVKYRVTYDAATQLYTAWVVPDYATPNTNNGGINELVSTAQVTLKVPMGFVIQNITDASGTQSWEKAPAKLGPNLSLTATSGTVLAQDYSPAVLDPAYAYYVIGKTPSESNLGTFVVGTPVALFTFKGNGCFGPIQPLPPGDPFIQAALDAYSFNVPNSFYSSSGQPFGGNQDPLEQFIGISGAPANCFQPPITTGDIAITTVGKPVTGNVLTNDSDPNASPATGGSLTASLLSPPTSGTVTLNPNGSYTYTPPASFTGAVGFCYSASNTVGLSSSACVTINVNPDPSLAFNDRPIASNDNTQTTMGVSVTINVAANDTDPDSATSVNGQLNAPTILTQPSVGVASVVNGQLVYTPPASFTGVVSFPYQICDKATPALCATAVVSINVLATPPVGTTLSPVAVDDALLTTKGLAGTGTVAANDSDPAGLPLSYTSGQPTNGTVVMVANGTYTYTPAAGYSGPDSFTYSVCNTAGKCDVATVSVTVQNSCLLPALAAFDVNPFAPSSCGGIDGSILLTSLPTNTSITVTYQKNGVAQTYAGVSDANGTLRITNLTPGNYGAFSFQTPTCVSNVYSGTVAIGAGASPPAITSSNLTKTNPSACASATGSIVVGGLTASTSYTLTYSKNGGATQTVIATSNASGQISLTALAAGNYSGFTVQKTVGCPSIPSSSTLVLTDPTAPAIAQNQLSGTNPTSCGTATGTLSISGLTASTSYTLTYSKNGGAAQVVVLTSTATGLVTISGLTQGSYQLTSLGTSNCTSAQTLPAVILADPAGPTLAQGQVSGTNPTNCSTATGFITLSGLTASTSYTLSYSKNGGTAVSIVQTSTAGGLVTITGLDQGNYTISSLGANNCSSVLSLTATLSDPAAPALSAANLVAANPTTCGTATGSFSVTGLNANASYTLTYQKDGGATQSVTRTTDALGTISLTGLSTGSYGNFVLTSNLGCSTAPLVGPFSLSNPSLPTPTVATLTGVNASCGGNDGKLLLTNLTVGQTFVFHYQLGSVAQAMVATVNASGVLSVTGLSPGLYSDFFITQGACVSGTYPGPINLSAICYPPLVNPDIANTSTAKPLNGNVLTNDTDPQGGPLTASLISQPTVGSVVLNPDGSYVYTPPTGFTGVAGFCYLATNTAGLSASTCVSINVSPNPSPLANDAPIANNDNTQTTMGVSVTINVAANDTDPDSATSVNGQLNAPTILTQPSVGVASVVNGQLVYTPPVSFTGVVSFPYQICDKATPALCATAVVSINVLATPPVGTTLSPVAVDDALLTTKGLAGTGTVAANDSDPAGLPLSYTSGQPTNGTVVMVANGTYTYTPAAGYSGPDSFTYTVCNTAGKCDVATVSVLVQSPANQAPVLVGEPIVTDVGKPVTVCMPIADADLADTHSVTVCGQPTTGTISTSVNNATRQVCVTYTPTPTFTGSTTACITVCDASGACTTTIIPITVSPTSQTIALPQPPVVIVEPIVTLKNTPSQMCMTIADPNISDTHSVSVCSSPAKGSVTATVNNTTHEVCITYSPTSGSVGADAICLIVCDQSGLCTQVIVPVTLVDPVVPGSTPVAPVVTPTPIVTTVGTPIVVCTGITDNPGDTQTATICGQPSSGSAVVSVNNVTHALCVTYTPGSTPASTTVCVQVCDQGGLCSTVTLPITVMPAPKALLLPHVWLQGALFGVTSATGVMRDDLRVKKYLPATSPYSGWTSITTVGPVSNTAVVFGVTGNDAIVDWVFVELRSPSNFSAIVDSRPALIQRDGDIVEIDGVSAVAFNAAQGSYYVSVKHRNHLGVMTATAIPLSLTGTSVDFRTPATPTYRATTSAINQAQVTVAQGMAMWAGNVFYDKTVIYQGTSNDVSAISNQVKGPLNIAGNASYILNGYYTGDVNLDGRTIYQGTGNDVNYIYLNVTKNHPGNAAAQNFFVIREQLP